MDVSAALRKEVLQRTGLILLPLAVVAISLMYAFYRWQADGAREMLGENERNLVELARQGVALELTLAASDISYLAEQPALRRWLAGGGAELRDQVAAQYVTLATHRRIYDQIRFVDLAGRERIRVDWRDGAPAAQDEAMLQDKSDRPYARGTLKLAARQIYLSAFDLNVERGQIEQPIKPTIRFGAPVFDARGEKRGIVVLNFLGRRLLDRLRSLGEAGAGEIWLLNDRGDALLAPQADDEWAFMYPDRRGRGFARSHAEAWNRVKLGVGGGQFSVDGDLITFAGVSADALPPAVDSPPAGAAPRWIVLARVPAGALDDAVAPLARSLGTGAAALLVLMAAGAWLVGRYWADRAQAERLVRQSEARFRGFLEAAPDAVVVTDTAGRIALVNSQTERLFGYPRNALVGQPVEMLVPERFRQDHVGYRAGYAAAPVARMMRARLELYGARRDGSEFPAAISLSPVQTAEGAMIIADIRDVTDQREAERHLQELNLRLERDNAALDALNKELEAFSYSVSHDLRAPLRAIDGFSQAVIEDAADRLDPASRGYLDRVRQAAQRMGLLIDDLLKLARIARTELSLDEVDLSALGHAVAREIGEADPARPARIVVAEGLVARADPRLLRIALENLVGNAWKFTAGRDPAEIRIGRAEHDGETAFFVRDNGVGFDMAYADKLFGAFQRLHDAKQFPGTGVGLATVQRIVRKHGGRIWAESAPGQGAAFYFTL